jgi:long-subunit acyl-CoA synthetase (AMP-forming)
MIGHRSGEVAPFSQIRWLATDEIPDALAERWSEPAIASDTLAMLQYTSGSTSQPKGVMLRAYPSRPAARKVIKAQTRWSKAR